ncbi:hypothetical protein [Desulfogranum marinum]|uniref:hypothetical protein n=1 Tax=Desulfogranum marinum TaxID=453220 RepID=UPI001966A502|nr:hypothetical protein [Desulfogranum marinum]MBM9514991.1 hypothetical protein [Desulfogranum marinum]
MIEKFGPINIFEDASHFLIRIHADNRDRAKKIPGRKWDGLRKLWVCPKTMPSYQALINEFKQDADTFAIDKPDQKANNKVPPRPQTQNQYSSSFNGDFYDEEYVSSSRPNNGVNIQREMSAIRGLIEGLKSHAFGQQNSLEEIQQSQQRSEDILTENLKPAKVVKTRSVIPKELKLSRKKDISLLENTIFAIACNLAGNERDFMDVIGSEGLLTLPQTFITSTHERLKKHLEECFCDSQPFPGFYYLLKHLKDEELIFNSRDDNVRVLDSLHMLNNHRNKIAHPEAGVSDEENWSRTIIYTLTLALIWPRISVSENGD